MAIHTRESHVVTQKLHVLADGLTHEELKKIFKAGSLAERERVFSLSWPETKIVTVMVTTIDNKAEQS